MSLAVQYTETYIANIALSELGSKEITNIETDVTKGGRLARLYYPLARDFVLASYPWSIARTRYLDVPAETTTPLWDWSFAHAMPPETLRVMKTSVDTWDVEGRTVVANSTPISLFTIDRVVNTAIYPPIMITALAKWLVALLATSLTANKGRKDTAIAEFRAILQQAETVDSYQGSYELFQFNELIEGR